MKYGFVGFYDEKTAKFAADAGFDGLEIFVGPVMDVAMGLDLDAISEDNLKQIMNYLGELRIGITTITSGALHLHCDSIKRADANRHFKKALQSAKKFGTDVVTTNAFTDHKTTLSNNMRGYKEVFSEYAKIAEAEGVQIAIENCPHWSGSPPVIGNLACSPEMWEAMFEAVPSKAIGLQFDPSHLVWQGIDYLRGIKEFSDRIYSFHAKDTEILPEEQYRYGVFGQQINAPGDWPGGWWRYRIPGFGQVDWKQVYNALYEIEYAGAMVIEHEDPVFGGDRSESGLGLGPRTEMGLRLGLAYLKSTDYFNHSYK